MKDQFYLENLIKRVVLGVKKKVKAIKIKGILDSRFRGNDRGISIFTKMRNFVLYHNAFAVALLIVFVGVSGVFAASTGFREGVIGVIGGEEEVASIDNANLLAADLSGFNPEVKVEDILEDIENYYVRYSYKTYAVVENVWQEVLKKEELKVEKKYLRMKGKYFDAYVEEELGEVSDGVIKYLSKAQEEETSGESEEMERTVVYTGLIGKILNVKEKIFNGYESVEEPQKIIHQTPDDTMVGFADTPFVSDEGAGEISNDEDNENPQPSGTMEPTEATSTDDILDLGNATSTDDDIPVILNDSEESEDEIPAGVYSEPTKDLSPGMTDGEDSGDNDVDVATSTDDEILNQVQDDMDGQDDDGVVVEDDGGEIEDDGEVQEDTDSEQDDGVLDLENSTTTDEEIA